MSDSKCVIEGLTKNSTKWESKNWEGTKHGNIFKCITAWTRWRNGKTSLTWVKGHSGNEGNEEADKLAGDGAKLTQRDPNFQLNHPPDLTVSGAAIAKLEQQDFYQIINGRNKIPKRSHTEQNLKTIKLCTKDTFNFHPTPEKTWLATKHKDFTKKTRDFLWKATQNAYKIGEFWNLIAGYEERGICPICHEQENMDHILTKCNSPPRTIA